MAPLWQRLIPKYGNYGGPGWSGGAMMDDYSEVDWSVVPSDSLDWLFHCHDKVYQKAIEQEINKEITDKEMTKLWLGGDKVLVDGINLLSNNPKEWPLPPTINSNRYAWFYRKIALAAFWSRVNFYFWSREHCRHRKRHRK